MSGQVEGQLALLVGDSPVSRFPLPGSGEAVKMTVTSDRKCCGLLKSSGPVGLLAKMLLEYSRWRSQARLLEWRAETLVSSKTKYYTRLHCHNKRTCFSRNSSKTLRQSVTPSKYLYFRLVPQMPRIDGTEFALLGTPTATSKRRSAEFRKGRTPNPAEFALMFPTPSTQEVEHPDAVLTESGRRVTKSEESSHSLGLADTVRLFPSPTPTERKSAGSGEKYITSTGTIRRKNADGTTSNMGLSATVASDGELNPDWVEWLMGFPFGWTDPDWEVDKSTMSETGRWLPEPDIPRVAVGVKDRVNRVKCLGNAVVPQQFFPVFWEIAEIEKEMEK